MLKFSVRRQFKLSYVKGLLHYQPTYQPPNKGFIYWIQRSGSIWSTIILQVLEISEIILTITNS